MTIQIYTKIPSLGLEAYLDSTKKLEEAAPEVYYVDNSILSTHRGCHEKNRLSHVLHLQPKTPGRALAFGHAFHAAVQAYIEAYAINGDLPLTNKKAGLDAMEADLKKEGANLPLNIINPEGEKRSLERCKMLFLAYLEKWAFDGYTILMSPLGKPYVEVGFAVDLGIMHKGRPIVYVGRVDRIGRSLRTRTINIADLKTTSQGLTQFVKSVKPNHQFTGYKWALREIMEEDIFGILLDAVFVSDRQPDTKKGGWFHYGIDFEKDFGRVITQRSSVDIEEFLFDARYTTMDYLQLKDSDYKRWERNDKECHKYGGCMFKEICTHNLNENIINTVFQVKPWEPWQGITDEPASNE